MVTLLKTPKKMRLLAFYFIASIAFVALPQVVRAGQSCESLFQDKALGSRLTPQAKAQVQKYLSDTVSSLEHLRGADGLIQDTIWIDSRNPEAIRTETLNANTSPTNIAADLLVQVELLTQANSKELATKNLSQILKSLGSLQRHRDSGLFFSWYQTDIGSSIASPAISSIDNLHLAIALWTIKETFPGTSFASQAQTLLSPMNLSMFYDESSGLIGGNFSYKDGVWVRDVFNYANLGSETRILYTAGWSLGLFKNYLHQQNFISKAFQALQAEVLQTQQGPLLKLWDGSAFQMFFPKMFVSEETVSPLLGQMYRTSGDYMISQGIKRQLATPASHSAGASLISEQTIHKIALIYNDKAGDKTLVSSSNKDLNNPVLAEHWDETFSAYALFMAATAQPEKFMPILKTLEITQSGNDLLYRQGLGWMDGLHVTGTLMGQVVPAQLAINQGMVSLSLLQMLSPDGLGASGRAIFKNTKVRKRMKYAYKILEEKITEKVQP
jgi:hypothetical protein